MSRNIIEFGFGNRSTSNAKKGDRLIAAEPLVNLYDNIQIPEGLDFFVLDEIAITGYNGVCNIYYQEKELAAATVDYRKCSQKSVECLSLDSWITRYEEQGFTDRIDFLNCVLNCGITSDIFTNFSFNPPPKFIRIRNNGHPKAVIDKLCYHGYNLYSFDDTVIAIRSEK